jgi:hypothetical protein
MAHPIQVIVNLTKRKSRIFKNAKGNTDKENELKCSNIPQEMNLNCESATFLVRSTKLVGLNCAHVANPPIL